MGKTKKGSQAWHRGKAVEIAKTLAKHRDDYTCQKCGKTKVNSQIQGSHVYSVGAYPNISAELDNIKALCSYCHRWWWHLNPIDATEWFESKFPKRAKKLRKIKNELVKRDWEQIHRELKQQLKSIEKP